MVGVYLLRIQILVVGGYGGVSLKLSLPRVTPAER
jgi:hypothetical protein